MENNCTLLVGSCDGYSDLWDPFFELLNRYWPDLPYDVVLSTETLKYNNDKIKVNVIHPSNPKCSWTERISETLKKITTDYVVFILDDFFLFDNVNTAKVQECLKWLKEDSKIVNFTFWPTATDGLDCKYNGFEERPKVAKYKVAAILAIWNKKAMLKYLDGLDENAWKWEVDATKRSNTIYTDDKFYIMQDIKPYIFPYDFTKYGLFSGKWFKDTKHLLKELNIKVDFKNRGFYDEATRGLNPSIVSAFELESAVIPNYSLSHTNSPVIFFDEKIKEGHFKQVYNVRDAHEVIRWEPSIQWGFGIRNLTIKASYKTGEKAIIDNKDFFGSYIMIDDMFVFNSISPNLYINFPKNKRLRRIEISGDLIFPLTETQLRKSFNKNTPPCNDQQRKNEIAIWYEFLTAKEKMAYLRFDSKVSFRFKNEYNSKYDIRTTKVLKRGKFVQEYKVPSKSQYVKWIPSSNGGYGVKNLEIYFKYSNGVELKQNINKICKNYNEIDKVLIMLSNDGLEVKLPQNNLKSVIFKGEFQTPLYPRILKKYLNSINRKHINVFQIITKIKITMKKHYISRVLFNLIELPFVFIKRFIEIFKF